MTCGGIRAEWLVSCDDCAVDVEPGRFYTSKAEAMRVRNRAVRHEAWLLSGTGKLVCPECAAEQPPTVKPGADCSPGLSPSRS